MRALEGDNVGIIALEKQAGSILESDYKDLW